MSKDITGAEEWREHGPTELSDEERYHAEQAQAADAVEALHARVSDPDDPLVVDQQAGDLLDDGCHVLRADTTVVISTWEGRDVTEYASEAEARKAFRAAAP